jgi:DUF1680 family protein
MPRLRPVPVAITSPFWTAWQTTVREKSLPHQFEQIRCTNRLENFRRAARGETGTFEGFWFNDSDVYKWIEAAAYALKGHDSSELRKLVSEALDVIEAAQMPDGYINSYIQVNWAGLQWKNLMSNHEMYCAGHLIEGAVALAEAGDDRLLRVAVKFADLLWDTFGPGKRLGSCGHEEVELALIKLADHTGDSKYRDLARHMIEIRGMRPSTFAPELEEADSIKMRPNDRQYHNYPNYTGEYLQDHAPIREHTEVVGHAVRAMYLYIAAAQLLDDEPAKAALQRCWENVTKRRMYVTGGIGPSGQNEGFTTDFDLPNLTAYAETCAAIGLVFWGQAMLESTGDGAFAEVIERAMYNGALSGISVDGQKFFYDNPLESRGKNDRTPWFGCACCPPNIARMIANIGRYFVGQTDDAVFIHQPVGFTASLAIRGVDVQVSCESNYPWDGKAVLKVEPSRPVEFALHVRLPDWSGDVSSELPGADREAEFENGYAVFHRTWQAGDSLTLDIELEPRWVESDPRVLDNLGRVALTRGPLIYCLEEKDAGIPPQRFTADLGAEVATAVKKGLGGYTALTVEGSAEADEFPDELYGEIGSVVAKPVGVEFVPYFLWNNRGANGMQVWVRAA